MQEIKIDEYSKTPKYKQIINSIISQIESKTISEGERLPSINKVLIKFDISRDTIVKAYDHLKQLGIIDSIPGKGYYVKNVGFRQKAKIFLLFNKLSGHKKILYDSFAETLGDQASIDFFIYNNDFQLFKKIILSKDLNEYTHLVIIPHFLEGGAHAPEFIDQLPKHKLIIIDKKVEGLTGNYAAVYQDFEDDIYKGMTDALPMLEKYQKIKLIFPPYCYHLKETVTGFIKFCHEFAFEYEVIKDISVDPIAKGDAYINLVVDDLVTLIKRVKELGLKAREDVGIISYNETPLMEVLLDGITIISTDFEQLGRSAAELVLSNEKKFVANPSSLVLRNSL